MNRADILDTAKTYCTADRAATHGSAENSFQAIGGAWEWWGSVRKPGPYNAYDVACMMVLFKLARMAGNPGHIDSAIDAAAYAALAGEIATGATE
jgi:hypothetical protein